MRTVKCSAMVLGEKNIQADPQRIDEAQLIINKFMGISDEVFLKYSPKTIEEPQNAEEAQQRINELMGIGTEIFCKYLPKVERGEDTSQLTEELQRRINKMMGIDDETFQRFKNKK